MVSTFWLSSRHASKEVQAALESVGFTVGEAVKSPSGIGVWVTVAHPPEDLARVTTMVTSIDSSATNEGSENARTVAANLDLLTPGGSPS